MQRAWYTVAFLKCQNFMCTSHGTMRKTRTNWLIKVSQPRCKLPPSSAWVYHLSCRCPRKQVLLWSFDKKSSAAKMATSRHRMNSKQFLLYNLFTIISFPWASTPMIHFPFVIDLISSNQSRVQFLLRNQSAEIFYFVSLMLHLFFHRSRELFHF